jgi:uncharacterized protein (DUF697 family)/tellurite resistance protein
MLKTRSSPRLDRHQGDGEGNAPAARASIAVPRRFAAPHVKEIPMNESEIRAVLTVALMAAFCDGLKDERERAVVKRIVDRLGAGTVDVAALYDDVLLKKPKLAEVVRPLASDGARQYAYEMAVGVVDADGGQTPAEAAFLAELAGALGLPAAAAKALANEADAIATVPVAATPGAAGPAPTVAGRVEPDAAELDRQVLNAAITNAALELLPESLASLAIIPLQMKLVYRIGQAYGYELDRGHITDFLATLGVGLTGQYLEQYGRKLLGGLLGAVAGGLGRAAGRQAASSGMSFATTWAIGQIARQYYAGGRTLDTARLKAAFAPLLEQAQALSTRYAGEIRQRAQTIDVKSLPALIGRA